jgi:hypothetical protein
VRRQGNPPTWYFCSWSGNRANDSMDAIFAIDHDGACREQAFFSSLKYDSLGFKSVADCFMR